MMPYIVTTKGLVDGDATQPGWDTHPGITSRRAVATLGAAKEAAHLACQTALDNTFVPARFVLGIEDFPESGSTVGPLPDGTVIEVEPVSWDHIRSAIGAIGRRGSTNDPSVAARADRLLDAYNARQA